MDNLQRMAVESVQKRGFHRLETLPENAHLSLLSAQRMRFAEEWGEFNRALRKNDAQGMAEELADVQIVLYQIAHCLKINLESEVVKKLSADERRGYLHGEKDDGPASMNGGGFAYTPKAERLVVADYADGAGVE